MSTQRIIPTEWWWPKDRSTVTHKFVKGPSAGDGALCGVASDPTIERSIFANDPRCSRCEHMSVIEVTADEVDR